MSERIYPPSRSKIIRPPTRDWPGQGDLPLGDLPSAAGTIIDRGVLPQLLRQGIGRMASVHEVEHFAQNFPRIKQLRQRSALFGQGVLDKVQAARERIKSRVRGQTVQPTPWGPRVWPGDSPLANLASVASIMSGPGRSMYAMQSREDFSIGDGRDIAIHQEWDNPYPDVNLAGGMSVHVE